MSFQPPTRCLGPTVSIGRTAGWWAAPTPMLSTMCPQRTAGEATSAWWLLRCAASHGPQWPMRSLSPTPVGFIRAATGRRTAWPCTTVSSVHSLHLLLALKLKEYLKAHFAPLQGFFQSALQSVWCSDQRHGFCHWWCHFLWLWVFWVHERSLF